MVDTLVLGTSEVTLVEVRILSPAPERKPIFGFLFFIGRAHDKIRV